MIEPTYDYITERVYERLPDAFTSNDSMQYPGYPLKRYLAGIGILFATFYDAYEAFDINGQEDRSALVDPALAIDEWLPWLAQMLGVGDISQLSLIDKRNAIADPSSGYRVGTADAIIAAARTVVAGSQQVGLLKFTTDTSTIGGASQWDILLVTRPGEATGDVVQQVIKLGAKPAGTRLHHREWEVTWADIHSQYPTWAHINALPNWDTLQRTGL